MNTYVYIDGKTSHINTIIRIWNLLFPDTAQRRVRRRINFRLNDDYRTYVYLEDVVCCGQSFSIIYGEL